MESKIFIGTKVTLEMRPSLEERGELQCIPFQGKEYVGRYIETPSPTVAEVRKEMHEIDTLLRSLLQVPHLHLTCFAEYLMG